MQSAQIAPVQDTAFRVWREGHGRGSGLSVVAFIGVVLLVIVFGITLQYLTPGWLSGGLIVFTAALLGALVMGLTIAPTIRKIRELEDKPLVEIEDPVVDHFEYLGYHYRRLRDGLVFVALLALVAWTFLVGFGPLIVPGLILVLVLGTLIAVLSHSQEKKFSRLEGSIADTHQLIGLYTQTRGRLLGISMIGSLMFALLAGALLWSGKYHEAIVPTIGLLSLGPVGWWDHHRIKQEESLLKGEMTRPAGA